MEVERKPLFDTFDWLIGIGAVPFQSPPIFAAAVLLVIARHWSLPARGFLSLFGVQQVTPFWCKVFPCMEGYLSDEAPPLITSSGEDGDGDNAVVASPLRPGSATPETERNGIAIDNNERNALLFAGRAEALAAMVHAGKVGETEGIKIVYGCAPSSTGKTYLAARELLKARLARLAPEKYRELDEDLQPVVK